VLTGDAAGVLDPGSGQGILSALMSGIMAAEAVARCVIDVTLANWHVAHYDTWFINQFEEKATTLAAHYNALGIEF
jgi:flavin-dependent dehydrogenase